MASNGSFGGIEKEVKFLLPQSLVDKLVQSLNGLTGQTPAWLLEMNAFFPPPAKGFVVRLRLYGEDLTFTFKGPKKARSEVRERPEDERVLPWPSGCSSAAEAYDAYCRLWHPVKDYSEKERIVWPRLHNCIVDISKLPGNLYMLEIEGPSIESIKNMSSLLSLDWEQRCLKSMSELWTEFCRSLGLPKATPMTFAGVEVVSTLSG